MRSLASSPATFAAGLAARHGVAESPVRMPPLSRVFRRMRRSVARVGCTVTFAPRIDVRVASFGRRTNDVHVAVRRNVVIAARPEHRPISAQSAESMIQRANMRALRVDGGEVRPSRSLSAPSIGVAERSAFASSPTQVPRVLRRRSIAPVEEPSAPPRDERSLRLTAPTPRAQQLSPVEVARLTDHIVQTIDRRIAAFRERQGRV
jgi:hypothetical protein